MARRPHKPFCRSIALVEALLLCCLFASMDAAAASAAAANTSAAGSTDALSLDAPETMTTIGGTDLYLETTLNGTARGLAHFGYRDGALWATRATLEQLGFALAAATPDPLRLENLRGVQAQYDAARQSANIVAPPDLLRLETQTIDTRDRSPPKANSAPGILLDYNLYGSRGTHGGGNLNALTELRAFNANGVLSNTVLSRWLGGDGDHAAHSVRMDTTWSSSFPASRLTLDVGDTLTAATSWSRPTRIGGIRIGTDFSLQPYDITTPLPDFFGTAALPSQVQLYINGLKQYSGSVPTGPFRINAVPGITGAGNAQVVLTNALGQVTTLDFALYGTQQLLRQGLSDWSAELGFVRENYGVESFDYGRQPMASGTWRHGFSNSFTGEAHAEATAGLFDGGMGGVWLLGDTGGVASAALARSTRNGLSGSQFSLGYNWTNSRFNFSVNGTRASAGYRDVAALYGGPPPRVSASAQAGFNASRFGNVGLGYTHLAYQDQINRYASAYWFRALGPRATLNFNMNQNLDQARDRGIFLTVSVSLDERTYASTSAQRNGTRNSIDADIVHSIPAAGGFGWRLQTRQGSAQHDGLAEVDYLGRYGQVQAGIADTGGAYSAYASANGALVLMGGGLFAARSIYDGFAVVSTSGIPDVPVKLENNLVGATDKRGLLLVTPLNAYQNNKVSIDPMGLPAGVRVGRVDINATPTDRAGTLVRFDITPIRAALIVLHDATGKPLPLGSRVRVRGRTGEAALVGFDGEVYLDTLGEHNALDVDTPAGACSVAFDYRKQGDGIAQIGPLTCTTGAHP